jgi:hypothetical protein
MSFFFTHTHITISVQSDERTFTKMSQDDIEIPKGLDIKPEMPQESWLYTMGDVAMWQAPSS